MGLPLVPPSQHLEYAFVSHFCVDFGGNKDAPSFPTVNVKLSFDCAILRSRSKLAGS